MIPTARAASTPSRRLTISASSIQPPHLGRSALLAAAVDLKLVDGGQEAVRAADLGLQRRDAGAHELHHPAAAGADQVIVALSAVHVLVEETAAAEPLLAREAARYQQVEVAVHRGARDLEPALPHGGEQAVGVDMTVLRENLVEQCQPLGGDPVAAVAQVPQEALELSRLAHRRIRG